MCDIDLKTMQFTEQQLQMMSPYNEIICEMYKQICKKRIEEDMRKHEEEIKAQMQVPTEEELHKAIQDLKMHSHEHIPCNPQPFYTKFLNKRNKRNKRK